MTMNLKPGLTAFALTAGLGLFAALAPLPVVAQETTTAPATAPADAIQDFSIGAVDAKVQITEYASFTCPHLSLIHI